MAAPGLLFLFVFAYSPVVGIIFRLLSGTDSTRRITRDTLLMNLLFISVSTTGATATMNAPGRTSASPAKAMRVLEESSTTWNCTICCRRASR